MSSTRRANKRARIRRRAENDAMRDARRESLFILLSRAQRGRPLTTDEAAQLRVAVEAEIREGDTARASERGQQRAMEEHRQRVEAADEAIREAEAEADRVKVDYLGACGTIARMHAAATGYDDRGPERGVVEDVADVRARMLAAEERAAQAEELLTAAHQCSNDAEAARAEAVQRAEQAEAEVEGYRAAEKYRQFAADTFAGRLDAIRQQTTEGLVEGFEELTKRAEQAERQRDDLAAELKQWRPNGNDGYGHPVHWSVYNDMHKRAATAEGRLDLIREMADAWETRLPATIRTATAAEAVRNAANGDYRPVMFGMADVPAVDWQARALRAELVLSKVLAAKTWGEVHTELGMFYRMKPEEAGQRARERRTAAERAAEQRAETAEARLDEQRRRADYRGAQLADALHRADTYRAAWHSARDRARKATRRGDIWKAKAYEIEQDRDRLAAELPLTAVPTRRPEVITDRATIRAALDEQFDTVRSARP